MEFFLDGTNPFPGPGIFRKKNVWSNMEYEL